MYCIHTYMHTYILLHMYYYIYYYMHKTFFCFCACLNARTNARAHSGPSITTSPQLLSFLLHHIFFFAIFFCMCVPHIQALQSRRHRSSSPSCSTNFFF